MIKYVAFLTAVLILLAVLPAISEDTPTIVVPTDYLIAPDDLLQMDVWGEPELKTQVQVTPDGNINVPFIGPVKAQGKTQKQLADEIGKLYVDREFLVSPNVNITLVRIHKPMIRVLGQVGRPGVIEFEDGDTVMEAIAQAGSYTESALLEDVTLTRKDSTEPIHLDLKALFHKGDMSQNLKLEKGDTIYIPEDTINKYYVLGEVLRPGLFKLNDNVTVLSAISGAGGPTPKAKLKSTMLIRGDIKKKKKVVVNVANLISKGDIKEDMEIKAGDVVYVPESNKPDWNKISSFLNVLTSVSYFRRYNLF